VKQSLLGFGRGVSWASAWGGRHEAQVPPEPQTDFIFSVIGEEVGFLGTAAVISSSWRSS